MQEDRMTGEELLQRYAPLVGKAVRRVRGEELEFADLWQEGCLLLLEGYREYKPETGVPLAGFLKAKVSFGLMNLARRKRYEASRFVLSLDKPLEEGEPYLYRIPGGEDPAKAYLQKEQRKRITSAINALTEKQRKVLVSIYLEDISPGQIAESMGISHQAVSKIKGGGIKKMARLLSD